MRGLNFGTSDTFFSIRWIVLNFYSYRQHRPARLATPPPPRPLRRWSYPRTCSCWAIKTTCDCPKTTNGPGMRTKRSGQSHTYTYILYTCTLSYSIFEDYLLAILVSVAARLGFRVFRYLLFLAEENPIRICKSAVISYSMRTIIIIIIKSAIKLKKR